MNLNYIRTRLKYDFSHLRYDNLATIERWTFINVRRQEREIEEAFDKYSVDNNFHEWGARVTEAMRIVSENGAASLGFNHKKLQAMVVVEGKCWLPVSCIYYYFLLPPQHMEPKWLIYVLAGTYWRIWGHPQHGIHCFRRALAAVPDRFKDVVLTNLAGYSISSRSSNDDEFITQTVIQVYFKFESEKKKYNFKTLQGCCTRLEPSTKPSWS